ncbi:M24 family metallopeptidase [bacterium]|nr:M24 family metallopeptidase [bacterium]
MRHAPIPPKLFIENRKRLCARLAPNSLVIVHANDIPPMNSDGTLPMVANSDLFYLSGIEQEETILMLAPDAFDEKLREVLFIRYASDHLKVWEGAKHSKQEASKISGVKTVKWMSELPTVLRQLMCEAEHVYLNSNEHTRAVVDVESRDMRSTRWLMRRFPLHDYCRLAPLMHELRVVKSPAEIDLLKKACGITRKAFLRVLKKVKPGRWEHEIEAEFAHEFIRNRARFAYTPIIAAGANSNVLHYIANDQQMKNGNVLLLDVGASYANYNADLTRTVPVNGRFSRRQKQVYNAVLRVVRAMIDAARPGVFHRDWQQQSQALMNEELLGLGLLKRSDIKKQDPDNPACRKYFMHGLGHPLGLDVHDVGLLRKPFAPGWVLTVEPGIYIPEEGFGVRLENDIVVTDGAPIDLMADIPIEAAEIEELMAK